MNEWYFSYENKEFGPFALDHSRDFVREHPGAYCWCQGWSDWRLVFEVPEIRRMKKDGVTPFPPPPDAMISPKPSRLPAVANASSNQTSASQQNNNNHQLNSGSQNSTDDSRQSNQTKRKPNKFWFTLGLCCILWAGISLFFKVSSYYDYYEYSKTREITNGYLQRVDFNSPPSFNFFFFLPYKWIDVQYEYTVNGHTYQGNRATLNDYVRETHYFQDDFGAYLQQAYREKQTIKVLYDPADPSNAVLDNHLDDQEFKIRELASIPFSLLLGYLLLCFSVSEAAKSLTSIIGCYFSLPPESLQITNTTPQNWSLSPVLSAHYPSNVMRSKVRLWFILAQFTIPVLIIIVIVALMAMFDGHYIRKSIPHCIMFIAAIIFLLKKMPQWKRFGDAVFVMSAPGKIGGEVKGDIFFGIPYDESLTFSIGLKCTYLYGVFQKKILWQEQVNASVIACSERMIKLPVSFTIADDSLSESSIFPHFSWEITVSINGILYHSYRIPVAK